MNRRLEDQRHLQFIPRVAGKGSGHAAIKDADVLDSARTDVHLETSGVRG